jgi:hypothetical protein
MEALAVALLPLGSFLPKLSTMSEYICRVAPSHAGHCDACWERAASPTIAFHLTGYTEPEQVYNLFFEKSAAGHWGKLLKSWTPTIQYGGVFTHQKPYVTYDAGKLSHGKSSPCLKKCELADLLIIFSDRVLHKRRAILFQAKKGAKWLPGNKTQWDLLSQWPEITYQMGSATISRTMPFTGHPDEGGKYMLLQKPHAVVNPSEPAYAPVSLEKALADIVLNKSGREFSFDRKSATDDWDELIWDLIEGTARTTATLSGTKHSRAVGILALCSGNVFQPEDPIQEAPDDDDEEWGIPIIQLTGQNPEQHKNH